MFQPFVDVRIFGHHTAEGIGIGDGLGEFLGVWDRGGLCGGVDGLNTGVGNETRGDGEL